MVTIKIILDKRKQLKNGNYGLCFLIYHKRKTTTRSAKIDIPLDKWDDIKKEVKRSHPDSKLLNQKLQKLLANIQSELLFANEEHINRYLNPTRTPDKPTETRQTKCIGFYQFANELVKTSKESGKIGNAWVYESTINALKRFHPEELTFEKIDYQFLDEYQRHLTSRDIKTNSIFLYLRTIRAFYNKAIKRKFVDRLHTPFDEFKLKGEKTRKRAISKELIKQINDLNLPEGAPIWHVRNWFLLSFYLIGISIIDLALLQPASYSRGRIEYKRRKTGKWYSIKVIPEADKIIRIYLRYQGLETGYILPIVTYVTKDEEKLNRNIKNRSKYINDYLAKLGQLIEYDGKITTYTVRHSWATIAKKLGFSNEIIAEALGHEYGNPITNVYLDTFDKEVIDDANLRVCQSVQ